MSRDDSPFHTRAPVVVVDDVTESVRLPFGFREPKRDSDSHLRVDFGAKIIFIFTLRSNGDGRESRTRYEVRR